MCNVDTKVRNIGFGWDAIDIFLFSNGQKCSPPRKYHLRTNELDWWEATLNHLARSHYGTSHKTMELYTLDGSKVQGPSELSDGMPYVAVVPPDTFKDAGYEKYIMKASRSLEKRKARKGTIDEESEIKDSDPVDREPVLILPSDLAIIKNPDESILSPSVMVKPEKSITQDPVRSEFRQLPKSIITSSSNYRNDKKYPTGTHKSFVKATPPTTLRPKRFSNLNKENNQTKMPRRISINTNDPVSSLTAKSQGIAKSVNKEPPKLSPTQSRPASPSKGIAMISLNSRGLLTESLSIQDLISDKEMIVIATDVKVMQNVEPNEEKVTRVDEMTDCYNPLSCKDEETQTKIEVSTCEVNTSIPIDSSQPNSKIKLIPATTTSKSNIMNCDIPLGDNCIAVINKGDTVNLNVNIELQKGQNDNINSNLSYKSARRASSLSDLFKKRNADHTDDPTELATKSLESVICDINECYAKVVMVQCACCGNKTAVPRVNAVPVYKDPNGFFILMPTATQNENLSCLCCPNHERVCQDRGAISAYVEELCKPKSSSIYPCVPQNVGMMMTITGSQTGIYKRNVTDMCMVAKQGFYNDFMYMNKDRRNKEECGTSPSRMMEVDCVVSTANIPKALPSHCMDTSTQTEWCSILLEAQRHEDGRYSFHLPPLQVLKHYSLL